jgi:transposase
MTWVSRRRKAFFREVRFIKELPIYLIDKYIVIGETASYYKRNREHVDCKAINLAQYKEDLKTGKIKSSIDFDDYYNPDLTLNVPFERDEKKSALFIKDNLFQIGKRWEERLKELFPSHQYTLVMYFDTENSDWFLDFYNGKRKIEESKDSNRFKDIHYFVQ